MNFDVFIADNRSDYASCIINALRDFETEHGANIKQKPHIELENADCLGCYATAGHVLLGGLIFSTHNEWVFLSSGFVWPIYRGKGVYSAIMRKIEEYAHEHNCNGIFVSTYTFEAPHIYEHLGFKKGSVLPDIPRGNTSIDYYKVL